MDSSIPDHNSTHATQHSKLDDSDHKAILEQLTPYQHLTHRRQTSSLPKIHHKTTRLRLHHETCRQKIILTISCRMQQCTGNLITTIIDNQYPITSVRWRSSNDSSPPQILLASNSEGFINHYHIPSGKPLFSIQEQNNCILALDTNQEGSLFATAGKDFNIRIYDQIEQVLESAQWNSCGHSNRVFSIKFIQQNLLISAGWDSSIYVWDLRTSYPVRSIFGVTVSGDTLDYKNNMILAGSHRNKQQVQIYQLSTGKLYSNINFSSKDVAYVIKIISNFNNDVLIGSSGANELRIMGQNIKYRTSNIIHMAGGCYGIVSNQKSLAFCNACADLVCLQL